MKQLNKWSCLAACFAYCLNLTEKRLYELVGHDGSELWWPELGRPRGYRAFHPQEFIQVCLTLRVPIWFIEAGPSFAIDGRRRLARNEPPEKTILQLMEEHDGIIAGRFLSTGAQHAMVWLHKKGVIVDPNGITYIDSAKRLADLEIHYFCIFEDLKRA